MPGAATPNMLKLHLQLRAGLPPHPSINTNPITTTTTTPIARIVDPLLTPTDPNTTNPNLTRIHNCNFINAKTTFKFKCRRRRRIHNVTPSSTSTAAANSNDFHQQDKSFWGAVTLIIGTVVGPGMLGLPAATIRSGPLPSTLAILLCWLYVISSVILVAELSFFAMEQDALQEVSFTALASKAFGGRFGAFVAVVYASLSFALLVACVSGIGSIVSQCFSRINLVLAHALFPLAAGSLILLFPFNAIDAANRVLCLLMLLHNFTRGHWLIRGQNQPVRFIWPYLVASFLHFARLSGPRPYTRIPCHHPFYLQDCWQHCSRRSQGHTHWWGCSIDDCVGAFWIRNQRRSSSRRPYIPSAFR